MLKDQYDGYLFDLDGVVYQGHEPIDHAAEVINQLDPNKIAFITNNASRTPDKVAELLHSVGVNAVVEQVVTSAQVAADTLLEKFGTGARVHVVGAQGLRDEITARSMVVEPDPESKPDAVVQGFTPEVTWHDLAGGAVAVAGGAFYLATNLDRTIPTAQGIAPGNGMMVKAVSEACGVVPESVGKPAPAMLTRAIERLGCANPLVIGDRLDTDIEAANSAGLDSLLVLTGVTARSDLGETTELHTPTFVADDLRSLLS